MKKKQIVGRAEWLKLANQLSPRHHKLGIIVGAEAINVVGDDVSIDLNSELSQALLNIPVAKRPRNVATLLGDMITELSAAWVYLVGLEVLFEPSLQVQVVSLLKQLAHDHVIVVLWPGEYIEGAAKLGYSELGHPEYQEYTVSVGDDFEVIRYQTLIKDTA